MKIDVFCHILPKRYKEELYKKAPPKFYSSKYADATQSLIDLDARFRVMDKYSDYVQVLSLGSPALAGVGGRASCRRVYDFDR